MEVGHLTGRWRYPIDGHLTGRWRYPIDGHLTGRWRYPIDGHLTGRWRYPIDGHLTGRWRYPIDGHLIFLNGYLPSSANRCWCTVVVHVYLWVTLFFYFFLFSVSVFCDLWLNRDTGLKGRIWVIPFFPFLFPVVHTVQEYFISVGLSCFPQMIRY